MRTDTRPVGARSKRRPTSTIAPSASFRQTSRRTVKFPNRVAEYRRAQVLKLAALARRVGCNADYLARVEAGKKIPGVVLFHDIARALGVLVDCLYDQDWSWTRRKAIVSIHSPQRP